MTIGKEPDYIRYSLEQLERARRSIDVERFPERTKILDILIADRKLRAAEAAESPTAAPEPDKPEWHLRGSGYVEYKSRGQVLMAAAGTIIIGGGGLAMMLATDLSSRPEQIFIFMWVAVMLLNVGHLAWEYHRLGATDSSPRSTPDARASAPPLPLATPTTPDPDPTVVSSSARPPHAAPVQRPPQGNTSPIQRL